LIPSPSIPLPEGEGRKGTKYMNEKINKVVIISMGLIGGSIGMSIKNRQLAKTVIGISRSMDSINKAVKKSAIDSGATNKANGVANADLIFICSPINMIIPALKEILPFVKQGCVITDVGSTKSMIVEEAQKIVPAGVHFIGGHPMAGSERAGIDAASAFLLDGANYVLTPTQKTDNQKLEYLKSFLISLDVNIIILNPEIHDAIVAAISHLPIVIAAALVNTISDCHDLKEEMITLASSGFRDSTRVASGNVDMGRDIFISNKDQLIKMIENYKKALNKLEDYISKGDLPGMESELSHAKKLRDSMYSA